VERARCCAAALGRIRAAVCLHLCMHASLLLGCQGEATAVIAVGIGRMRKPSARAVPPFGLS
jgi:hypothetical protein